MTTKRKPRTRKPKPFKYGEPLIYVATKLPESIVERLRAVDAPVNEQIIEILRAHFAQ